MTLTLAPVGVRALSSFFQGVKPNIRLIIGLCTKRYQQEQNAGKSLCFIFFKLISFTVEQRGTESQGRLEHATVPPHASEASVIGFLLRHTFSDYDG
ncbi:MAG: hypothetical protein MZV65_00665 [Chromatiales bacterium]|nr:hypothetical protein [Chromatiales bacterium]